MVHPLASSIVIVVGVVAIAIPASADTSARCHSAIAKSVSSYQLALFDALAACHVARSAGEMPLETDCNDAVTGDLRQKAERARQKGTIRIGRACSTSPEDVRALYARCPAPVAAADNGGATDGIDDFAELAECLFLLSDAWVERLSAETLGNHASVPAPAQRECQAAIAGSAANVIKAAIRERNRCQKRQQSSGGGLAFEACAGDAGDAGGRIAESLSEMEVRIDESCNFDDGYELHACGHDAASLLSCIRERVTAPLANGLVASAQGLPGRCASVAMLTRNAAGGPKHAMSRIDFGYSGLDHGMDVVDGSRLTLRLSDCDTDCDGCAASFDTGSGGCRCSSDSSILCSTIGGADAACGGGTCECYAGPPRPESGGGLPRCTLDRLREDFAGQAGADGDFELEMSLAEQVHLGISQASPCPVCNGDDEANDGAKDGTCRGGASDGTRCDANGRLDVYGHTSFDCMPDPGSRIDTRFQKFVLTSGTSELVASIADSSLCAGGTCHCSACSGDSSIGCSTDDECASAGAGTCGTSFGAKNPRENVCQGGPSNCVDDGNGSGSCSAGPLDRYCDGFVQGNGRAIVPCSDDFDCDANDCDGNGAVTAGECGTCSIEHPRDCFLPTVTATGEPGLFHAAAAATSCVASPNSMMPGLGGYLTGSGGFPGPSRVRLDFDIDLFCADRATRFELPGGASCP